MSAGWNGWQMFGGDEGSSVFCFARDINCNQDYWRLSPRRGNTARESKVVIDVL